MSGNLQFKLQIEEVTEVLQKIILVDDILTSNREHNERQNKV